MAKMTKKELINYVGQSFNCMGGGRTSTMNPIVAALSDKPLMFCTGVDVKEVVSFVLARAKDIKKGK